MPSPKPEPAWKRWQLARVPPEASFEERKQIQIISGSALAIMLVSPIFLLANIVEAHLGLAWINAASVLAGMAALLLVRRRFPAAAAVLLIIGGGVPVALSAFFYRTGMEYSLLIAMLGTVFLFDSAWTRIPLSAANALGFVWVKTRHLEAPLSGDVTANRHILNIVIFLICYHTVLELLRRAYADYHARLELANAELAESRRRLREEHERLMQRTEDLHVANQAKEKLFSIIAHDLRNPVGGLKSVMDLLKSGALTADDFKAMLPDLTINVGHAYESLDMLLTWSASQLRAITPVVVDVPLARAVDDCTDLLASATARKEIRVASHVPADARVRVDRDHLLAIVRNLVANALKFTPAGGRVEITATRQDDFWRVTVADNGIGMLPKKLAGLFTNHVANPTPGTANERGLGLGLTISREFVESNGGVLSAESEPGRGSCFHFTLPAADKSD